MFRQMQYFVAVVETGSFSEAAERCHISQSAISQQVKALEDELGAPLLERHGRRFSLTPAGQYFFRRAKRQVAELESILREVRRIGRGEQAALRVGVLTGFGVRPVQAALQAFAGTHPNVQIALATGTHEALFRQVVGGQLDLVINDQRRALSDQFVNEELVSQPLLAMVRQDSGPAREPGLELAVLRGLPCVLPVPPEQREAETGFWRDVAGVESDILFADSVEAACMCAAAGTGWYPCDRDAPARTGTALVPLLHGGAPLTRRMFAFWLESNDSSLQWEFSELLARQLR